MFKKILDRLNRKIRVHVIDNETLSEARVFIFKPLTLIILSTTVLIGIILTTASLIIFIPFLRERIPGYLNPQLESKQTVLINKLYQLENLVAHQDSFIKTFQKVASINYDPSQIEEEYTEEESKENSDAESQESTIKTVSSKSAITNPSASFRPTRKVFNLLSPVDGIVTNSYNDREKHYGIDLAANENAVIKSITSGFVIFSEYSTQTGYVIGISHGDNLISFYKHNSMVFKKVGSYVFPGEAIAIIGNSGENSTGPHLHFELWQNGKSINPADFISFN